VLADGTALDGRAALSAAGLGRGLVSRDIPAQRWRGRLGAAVHRGRFVQRGAMLYALRWPDPWPSTFGYHEFFHACNAIAAIRHYYSRSGSWSFNLPGSIETAPKGGRPLPSAPGINRAIEPTPSR
jgi:hypothetical protein